MDVNKIIPQVEPTKEEMTSLIQGLWAVAWADKQIRPEERKLIEEFEREMNLVVPTAVGENGPQVTPAQLKQTLTNPQLQELFIRTALLICYADGEYSAEEHQIISEFAAALNMPKTRLTQLEDQTKELLLAQLAHLKNVQGVADVARKRNLI